MSNDLSEKKQQQVIALGRLGWPVRRIEQETGVRRETAGSLHESGRGPECARQVRGDGDRLQNRPTKMG
jgi:hypothetical protein